MSERQDPNEYPSRGGEGYQPPSFGQQPDEAQTYRGSPSQPYGRPANPSQPFGGNPAPYDPYGQYGQYGQPASPSQPYQGSPSQPYGGQGYGQPAGPSQPYAGTPSQPYGRPASPSQPYPGSPSQPYGQPASPSQPYAPYGQPSSASQPFYGQQTIYTQPPVPKNRRGLKIALTIGAIVVVLGAVIGGVAVFAISTFTAPGAAALTFCNNLKTQNYDGAYKLLSARQQSQYPQEAFRAGVSSLDTAEGKVIACQQAQGSNSYDYSFGASTANVGAQLTRETQGNLTGSLHLTNQNGSWKVDSIDTSLLGVNIGALQAAGAFCAAMQGHDYTAAYTLLDSAQQGLVNKDDFVASGALHDQIDGTVTKCALAKVPQGNTDQLTHLTIDLTRAHLGDRTGSITLKVEGSAWKVDATEATLNGTDLHPLVVGGQFCALFTAAKYGDAYGLFSKNFQATISKDQFVANFATFEGMTLAWSCGTPDYSTYTVTSTSASIVVPLTISIPSLGTSANATDKYKVEFIVEGGVWKINDLIIQGAS
jgi:hypothetical protein